MNQGIESIYPGEKVWRIQLNTGEALYRDESGQRVVGEAVGPGRFHVHSDGVLVVVDGHKALLRSGSFEQSFLATSEHDDEVRLELYLGRSVAINPIFWKVPEHVTEFAGWIVPPSGWTFVEPVYTFDALDPERPTGAPSGQVCRPVRSFFVRNDEDREAMGWTGDADLDFETVDDFPAPFLAHSTPTEFSVELPQPNEGIQIARFYNAREGRQRAKVWVDGEDAGTWYVPMSNAQEPVQADSFGLPLVLTKGKSRIRVRIEPDVNSPKWTVAWYGIDALIPRVL